jgi:hypothetical protein
MRTTVEKVVMAIAVIVALAVVGAVNLLLLLHRWAIGW